MKHFTLIVIGDEIISGKRADAHFPALSKILGEKGLKFSRVEYAPDNREQLAQIFKRTQENKEVVFSCGGIGNTPDDHTRQAAAMAFHQNLKIHAEGFQILKTHFGEIDSARALLVEFPEKTKLIPNPFNFVPGFYWKEHYFVPGFPQMAHPMLEWVLENFYQAEFSSPENTIDRALLLTGREAYESALLPLMQHISQNYPTCRLYSLPFVRENAPYHLELGLEGAPPLVEKAFEEIILHLQTRDLQWRWRE